MRIIYFYILMLFLAGTGYSAKAQCTVVSTNGYVVHLSVVPTAIVVSSTTCPYGYNFNYKLNYSITFTGINIPSSLSTLQGNVLAAGYSGNFFDLPNNAASGTATSTGNSYNTQSNCNTVTVSSFNPTIQIQIQGAGIPNQNINCPYAALPVQFTSFTGLKIEEGILLKWTTASEKNDSYFTVEKSDDNSVWTPLAQLNAAGNSDAIHNYSYTDTDPYNKVNYYRIKQTDVDGIYSYTNIVGVDDAKQNIETNVYPNPAVGSNINIRIATPSSTPVELQVFNSFGQNLKSYTIDTDQSGYVHQNVELPGDGNTFFITIMQDNAIIGKHQVRVIN